MRKANNMDSTVFRLSAQNLLFKPFFDLEVVFWSIGKSSQHYDSQPNHIQHLSGLTTVVGSSLFSMAGAFLHIHLWCSSLSIIQRCHEPHVCVDAVPQSCHSASCLWIQTLLSTTLSLTMLRKREPVVFSMQGSTSSLLLICSSTKRNRVSSCTCSTEGNDSIVLTSY